jgi:hypothetical protein
MHFRRRDPIAAAKIIYRRIFPKRRRKLIFPDSGPLEWHQSFIEHLAFLFRPQVYVELGIRDCALFNRIERYAERLIGVDIDAKAGNFMIQSNKVEFVCATTQAFAERLRSTPISIDFLFIDADHARDAVLRDFWNFFPFVRPHGLILLHDTHPKDHEQMRRDLCDDAYLAIDELTRAKDALELMTLPLPPGLTLCRKRQTQLSWMEADINPTDEGRNAA